MSAAASHTPATPVADNRLQKAVGLVIILLALVGSCRFHKANKPPTPPRTSTQVEVTPERPLFLFEQGGCLVRIHSTWTKHRWKYVGPNGTQVEVTDPDGITHTQTIGGDNPALVSKSGKWTFCRRDFRITGTYFWEER